MRERPAGKAVATWFQTMWPVDLDDLLSAERNVAEMDRDARDTRVLRGGHEIALPLLRRPVAECVPR